MFVLGIDPGLSRCGYCALEVQGRKQRVISMGLMSTPPDWAVPQRLAMLQRDVRELIAEVKPEAVAIERVLFQVNVQTAMYVGQASGVVMAEAAGYGCDVIEYSPNQVKETVAGHGAAGKEEVGEMVRRLLRLAEVPKPADVADAAAIALCHAAQAVYR